MRLNSFHFHTVTKHLPLPSLYLLIEIQRSKSTYYKKKKEISRHRNKIQKIPGGMYLPHCDSARILIGVWWLIVMVVVATYSGSLVAFLTFPRMDASILTVDDLLARKDGITWSFPNGSFLEMYLQETDEPKYHTLLSRAESHNDTEEEKLVERVKDGKHALIDWRSSLRYRSCQIHTKFREN